MIDYKSFYKNNKQEKTPSNDGVNTGGIDGARTRDLLRDRTKTVMLICFESY